MTCEYCDSNKTFLVDVTGENDKIELCVYHGHSLAEGINEELFELSLLRVDE